MANDIEKVRAQAHDANVANKIIDSLKELQQSSDEKSRCRWGWELIQNAKDVANSSGSVDVKISFNEQQRILQFAHNGKPFSMQNIVFLIEQVSTKDRDEKEETKKSTGKFGTGFLTTHLLSEIVTISGVLQDENSQFKKFELDINRSEKTREGIIGGNKKSFEQLQNSIDNGEMIFDFNEDLFNTSFTYRINENGLGVAKEGLDNLYDALPYVFMFVPEIRSVSVEEYAWKFTRGKLCLTQNKDIKVQEIIVRENEEESGTYIAAIQGANVAIAAEVEKHGNHVAVKEFTNQLPRIFCDFPLIGTEDFAFPAVVNSSQFNPTEPRNGIFLKDVDEIETKENKKLMMEAVQLYGQFLEYVSRRGWEKIYNFVKIRTQREKIWLSTEWVEKYIINECKNTICKIPIVDNKMGSRVALLDEWGETNIWIVHDTDAEVREEIWKLASDIMPNMMTDYSELNQWYFSLWKGCNRYSLQNLVLDVQELGKIDVLEEKLCIEGKVWLNRLYALISKTKGAVDYIKNNKISIFSNQNGVFCTLDKLSVDVDIDEIYKDILNLVQSNCRNGLLDKEITVLDWMSIPQCSLQDIFASIKNGLSSYPEQKDNIYSQIVVLYTNDDEVSDLERKQTELLEFADVIFPNRLPNDLEVSAISPELLEEAIKYLCIQVVDEISKYENLENLNWLFNFNEETIEKWISRFIEYINAEGYGFLLDRKVKTILPNQNGKFKAKEELFLDNGDMDEILKDISAIAGYDIREELLLGDVFLALPDNRTKSIADIAPHIISYVKKNQGSSKVQDSNVMDTFKKLYYWVKDNSEKAEKYFNEICENIHWLYNDVEIAENMKKAEQIDAVLERCHINDISILEKAFLKMANRMQEADSVINSDEEENEEELLVQYGIASEEQYEKALDMQIFKENFLHTSSHDVSKFDFANRILERAKNNIIEFLGKKSEYDISNLIEVDKTIFIIEKNKEQIYLITRPSDYSYVAIYYDSEKNVLDYNKDWELWVEDGKKEPEKITFGKMLKLTGINKIPLKKV